MPSKKYFGYKSASYGLVNFTFLTNHATLFQCRMISCFSCSEISKKFRKTNSQMLIRNRKHVPCFHEVIATRVKVWENEK